MKLKVIVKVPGRPDPRQLREQLIQRYRLNYTDLLEIALMFWEMIEDQDDEALHSALEHHLTHRNRRIARYMDQGRLDYSAYVELTQQLAAVLHQIHDALEPILTPLVSARWHSPVDYRLSRFIGTNAAAVIEIQPRLE